MPNGTSEKKNAETHYHHLSSIYSWIPKVALFFRKLHAPNGLLKWLWQHIYAASKPANKPVAKQEPRNHDAKMISPQQAFGPLNTILSLSRSVGFSPLLLLTLPCVSSLKKPFKDLDFTPNPAGLYHQLKGQTLIDTDCTATWKMYITTMTPHPLEWEHKYQTGSPKNTSYLQITGLNIPKQSQSCDTTPKVKSPRNTCRVAKAQPMLAKPCGVKSLTLRWWFSRHTCLHSFTPQVQTEFQGRLKELRRETQLRKGFNYF